MNLHNEPAPTPHFLPFLACGSISRRAQVGVRVLDSAKEALRRAFALDEELRLEAVKDDRLSAVW